MDDERTRSGMSLPSTSSWWVFLREYLANPRVVGSVTPSSKALAAALCAPYQKHRKACSILEVGAGTGAVTRQLGSILGTEDQLHICEKQPQLVQVLRDTVLCEAQFAVAVDEGRVKLLQGSFQEMVGEGVYDFVVCGLPFTAFDLSDVEEIYAVLRKCLKPQGVFSYFEYVGLRRVSRIASLGQERKRIRSVSAFLSDNIRRFQFDKQFVPWNMPPAWARHLRFS